MRLNSIGEATRTHYTFGKIRGYKKVSHMLPNLRKFNVRFFVTILLCGWNDFLAFFVFNTLPIFNDFKQTL